MFFIVLYFTQLKYTAFLRFLILLYKIYNGKCYAFCKKEIVDISFYHFMFNFIIFMHGKYKTISTWEIVDIPFFPLFVKVCPMGTNQGYTILSYTLTQAYITCLSTSTYMCYTLTRVQNLIRVHNTKMAFLHFFFEVSHY